MTEPLIHFDFEVGIAEVDEAHQAIQQEAARFQRMLGEGAARDDIIAGFTRLRDLIVGHFLLEEKVFAGLEKTARGADHVQRHRDNHRVTTDAFTYAFDKLADAPADAPLPNIIPLIPKKYLSEMLTMDREMTELLAG